MSNVSLKRVALTGIAGGLLAGAVKMGWENIAPPRTPKREEEPPPETLLKALNVPESKREVKAIYNQQEIPITIMGVHYGFSVFHALVYAAIAERCPEITKAKGSWFGIAVHVVYHEFLLPQLKLTPPRKDLPPQEHVSEFFGHVIWGNVIELVRSAIK